MQRRFAIVYRWLEKSHREELSEQREQERRKSRAKDIVHRVWGTARMATHLQ